MYLKRAGSFTKEGTGSGRAIFEGGFKLSAYESKKKFYSTASADWGSIGEQTGSNRGVIGE